MPFHFSSGISVFIIEHVPGFFSMRHSLTSLTLDLLLLLLTCHTSPQKKSENKCNVSSDFFTVEVRVEVFPPLLHCWSELLQLLVRTPTRSTTSQIASSQLGYILSDCIQSGAIFSTGSSKKENFFKLLIKIISIKGNIDIP